MTPTRTMRYDRLARRLTITLTRAGRRRPDVTEYLVEGYESDMTPTYAVLKLDAGGEPCERYDVCLCPGSESCSCPDGCSRGHRRPCKHAAALIALRAAGRLQ